MKKLFHRLFHGSNSCLNGWLSDDVGFMVGFECNVSNNDNAIWVIVFY